MASNGSLQGALMTGGTKYEESPALIRQLEERLAGYLGIRSQAPAFHGGECPRDAVMQPVSPQRRQPAAAAFRRLRVSARTLQEDAARLGTIPEHYPWHVNLVMRLISALLPWYTRSLVQFGQRTAQTMHITIEVLEEIVTAEAAPGPPGERLEGNSRPESGTSQMGGRAAHR
jgi:hypothetical protein